MNCICWGELVKYRPSSIKPFDGSNPVKNVSSSDLPINVGEHNHFGQSFYILEDGS